MEKSEWRIKGLKDMKPSSWLIVILAGILLLVIALPTTSSSLDKSKSTGLFQGEEKRETDEEGKLEEILTRIEGIDEAKVMIQTDDKDCVQGILVVARGADQPVTVKKIKDAVMALFQIDAHKIEVMNMK